MLSKPEKTVSVWVCQCWTQGSCENIRWPIKKTHVVYSKNEKCSKHLWIFFYPLDIVSNPEFSLALIYLDIWLIYCWFSIDTKDCKTEFLSQCTICITKLQRRAWKNELSSVHGCVHRGALQIAKELCSRITQFTSQTRRSNFIYAWLGRDGARKNRKGEIYELQNI